MKFSPTLLALHLSVEPKSGVVAMLRVESEIIPQPV